MPRLLSALSDREHPPGLASVDAQRIEKLYVAFNTPTCAMHEVHFTSTMDLEIC